jgi:hypothetical protein
MFIWLGAGVATVSTVLVTTIEGIQVVPTVGLASGWALLLVGLTSGRLMTRGAHDEQVAVIRETYQRQVDDVIHDRGEWRTQSRITDSTVVELLDQQRGLMTSIATTVAATMDAIKDNASETHGGAS